MGNLGASYFGKDQEAAQWAQIAGIASKMNDKFEKEHISSAYETLKNGGSLPDDTRDSIKVNATKLLRDNLEGETVAAEQQIMADIASKAKEQGVGIHDYLKGNVESYLTTPASYRAVGNISKMFQERQLADASYQKAKMEEGVNRFKEVSSLVQAADGLYKKGDLEGSRKMVEQISRIVPIPGFAKTNDETGELEGYATDFDKGGHKPAGMKFDVGGFLNAAKQVTRDEFAYGYALNSQVVNEMNAKNLAEASIMKDKGGGRYMGFNFVNPYDATDTKFIVKQEGTGKTVGQFASMQDATDSGYTPYNQKYEKGELDIANEKRQGRNLDLSARNLELSGKGLGLDNIYKRLRNDEQGVQTDIAINTRDDKIKYEKFKSLKEVSEASKAMYDVDKAADEKEQRELESRANLLEASLTGGGVFNGKKPKNASGDEDGSGVSYGIEEMKNAKAGVDRLVDMGIDRQLIPGMTQKAIKDSVKYTDNPDQYNKAFLTSLSVSTGMPVEAIQAYDSPSFRALPYDEKEQIIQKKISESTKIKAEEQKATEQKKAESVFEGIRQKYKALEEEAKNRVPAVMSSSLMPPSAREMSANLPIDKTELLFKAMKEPLFGEGLYDIKSKYYPKTTDEEFINILMDYMSKADTAEMQKRQAMAQAGKADKEANQNKKTFYRFEGLRDRDADR